MDGISADAADLAKALEISKRDSGGSEIKGDIKNEDSKGVAGSVLPAATASSLPPASSPLQSALSPSFEWLPRTPGSAPFSLTTPTTDPGFAQVLGPMFAFFQQQMQSQQQFQQQLYTQQQLLQSVVDGLKKPTVSAESKDCEVLQAAFASVPVPVLQPTKSAVNLVADLKSAAGPGAESKRKPGDAKASTDTRPAISALAASSASVAGISAISALAASSASVAGISADTDDDDGADVALPIHERPRVHQLLAFRDKHKPGATMEHVFKSFSLKSSVIKKELLVHAVLFDRLVADGLDAGSSGLESVARKIVGLWESDKSGLEPGAAKLIGAAFTGDDGPPSIAPAEEITEIYRSVSLQHRMKQKLRSIGASEVARAESKKPFATARKAFADNPPRTSGASQSAALLQQPRQHKQGNKTNRKKSKGKATAASSVKASALGAGAGGSSSGASANE